MSVLLLLFLLFTSIPIFEVYLLLFVSDVIGGAETLFLVILTGFIGATFAKSQGRAVLVKLQQRLASGQMPGSESVEALLIFLGGVLLLTPGFATDIFGLCCLFPFTRPLIAKFVQRYFEKRVQNGQIIYFTNMKSSYDYSSSDGMYQDHIEDDARDVTPDTSNQIDGQDSSSKKQ